jgi:hypothetical protein
MIMKKTVSILLSGLFVMGLWSCSEDLMDEINKNVNDPTEVGSHLVITDAMVTSAFSITGSDLAFYASVYIEHNVGIWNQSYSAEIRTNEPSSSTTYNNSWNTIYNNLFTLKTIIKRCSEGGAEEGNYYTLGIAQVLTAYNLAYLTDLMGDVPWSEALQPGIIYTPKLDKQEDIYRDIMQFLDDAIANFEKECLFPTLGGQDFIFGGNIARWKQFAYGLKARYTMRLSLRSAKYEDVITFANQSFTSAAQQCQFNYNGTTTKSPFYMFFTDRDYFGASQSLHDKLVARSDPRDAKFFKKYPGTDDLIFAPNGEPQQKQGLYGISAISNITAPTYLLSYHELEFLKAEAYVRLGGVTNLNNAKEALEKGITAAFQKVNIDLTASDASNYFTTQVEPLFDANPLQEVMVQKYLAFFEEEAVEAYNDYRRLVAMGDNVIALSNPFNPAQFPKRYTYGASDVTTNVNVREAYGDGQYVYTENVWWAGGTR